jgi:threonine aldolase
MKSRGVDHNGFTQILREKHNILVNASFTNDAIRIVTHRDVSKSKIEQVLKAFKSIA